MAWSGRLFRDPDAKALRTRPAGKASPGGTDDVGRPQPLALWPSPSWCPVPCDFLPSPGTPKERSPRRDRPVKISGAGPYPGTTCLLGQPSRKPRQGLLPTRRQVPNGCPPRAAGSPPRQRSEHQACPLPRLLTLHVGRPRPPGSPASHGQKGAQGRGHITCTRVPGAAPRRGEGGAQAAGSPGVQKESKHLVPTASLERPRPHPGRQR